MNYDIQQFYSYPCENQILPSAPNAHFYFPLHKTKGVVKCLSEKQNLKN